MTPAVRWGIGLVLALIAGTLWMFWNPSDRPKSPVSPDAAKQPVAAAPVPAPVQVAATPAPAPAPAAPKAEEPLTASVFFDFDHSALRSGEVPKLDELAARIKGRTFERLDAVGHADRIGEEPYNAQLSRKRADAVVAYLVGKGVEAGRIHAEARGEAEAITGDACKDMGPDNAKNQKLIDCLQRDRQVELKLVTTR